MAKALRDHFLRIDARSLGLFRIAFGLVLIFDLFRRWRWLRDLYSNDGVLANHNHLFNLRDTGQVWSVYHAFSSPGENHFAFTLTLLVFITFLLGVQTRVFHALSLILLVSLTCRNILLENAGNYAAIALLAFTLFLPLGSRFSLDALGRSLGARDEKTAEDLNDRKAPDERVTAAERAPGWTPTSIAALAVLLQIAIIYLCSAIQHNGAPWKDGSALYYGLHIERWVSGLGVAARSALPPGVLKGLTYLLYGAEWAIPVLLFVPLGLRVTRSAAGVLMLVHGLLLGLLFSFGLYAWTLIAAIALVIPSESWDAWARSFRPERVRTVIYDADCGICLWLSRLAKRLDGYGQLAFQGNDDLAGLWRLGPDGKLSRGELPSGVTEQVVQATVVVVGPEGQVFTRSRAVAEVIGALPLGRLFAWPLRIPGVSHLADILYDVVGKRRAQISELFGFAACGVPEPEEQEPAADAAAAPADGAEVAPALKVLRGVTGTVREAAAFAVLLAMLAQTGKANALPSALVIPQWRPLQSIAAWPRMLARWDVLAPAPPLEDGMLVIDAQTRGGQSIDLLTNREPVLDLPRVQGTSLGQLWMDYLYRIRLKEWEPFQKAFRDYLAKGGRDAPERPTEGQPVGFDAYWVTDKTPPPGSAADFPREAGRVKLFTHSRGGKLGAEKLPLLRPDVTRPQQ